MADYGIRVINQATGSIQIDQNYTNLEVYGVYNLTTTANEPPPSSGDYEGNNYLMNGYSHAKIRIEFTWDGTLPLPASPSASLVGLYGNYQHSIRIARNGISPGPIYYSEVDVGVKAPVGTTVQLMLYSRPESRVIPGNWGLVVKNADGGVTFNSNRKYQRVVDVVTGADCRNFTTKTYPAGRQYVCTLVGFAGRSTTNFIQWFPGGLVANYRYNEWAFQPRMNGNVLTGAYEKICDDVGSVLNMQGEWPGNRNFKKYDFTIMVFDVTYYMD